MTGDWARHAIRPAARYTPARDLWVVSTYFDSEGYSSKLRALNAYLRVMERSGIPLLLVEGAFGRRRFLFRPTEHVVQVRCASVMWQKERLLNIGIQHLPPSARKVAWLDTDVFFENPDWAVETSTLLDSYPVVQPFEMALWLPKGITCFRGRGIAWPGFAAVAQKHPGTYLSGDFDRHGHSGYGWAARRELVEGHGLYDRSVVGSGDHLMAHAMMGDLSSPCVTNSVGAASPFRTSFHSWARPFHDEVRSRIGYVPGAVLHRWHGDRKKRRYYKRMVGLLARRYDPAADVEVSASGALEWTEHGRALGRWMRDYFAGREEDGVAGPADSVTWEFVEGLRQRRATALDEALLAVTPLLGPLATLISERSEDWLGCGLTPVLPNLVAALLILPSTVGRRDSRRDASPQLTHELPDHAPQFEASLTAAGPFPITPINSRSPSRPRRTEQAGGDEPLAASATLRPAPMMRNLAQAIRKSSRAPRDPGPVDTARSILEIALKAARTSRRASGRRWKNLGPRGRWVLLIGKPSKLHRQLADGLSSRLRDPRWNDAPELRTATVRIQGRRADHLRKKELRGNPYDAVLGPGSSAAGLEHV